MSHYTQMSVEMQQKNEADLIAALEAHFGPGSVEFHENGAELKLWNGGKASKDVGYGTAPKCEIIVRRDAQSKAIGHAVLSNDLGYKRNENGTYDVHLDTAGFPLTAQQKVAQNYTERVASRKLKAQGYTLKREVLKDGRIKLVAQKYA